MKEVFDMNIVPQEPDTFKSLLYPEERIDQTPNNSKAEPTPFYEITNRHRLEQVSDGISGWANRIELRYCMQNIIGLTEYVPDPEQADKRGSLYFDFSSNETRLRYTVRLSREYTLKAGKLDDATVITFGLFLETLDIKASKDNLFDAFMMEAKGKNNEKESNDFLEMKARVMQKDQDARPVLPELVKRLGLKNSLYTDAVITALMASITYKQTYRGEPEKMRAPRLNVILYGDQESGKTTFARGLVYGHYKDISKASDFQNEDWKRQAAGQWLALDDDLTAENSRESVGALKEEITRSFYETRLPYTRTSVILAKRATHVGTTNIAGFITDTTSGGSDTRTYILETQTGKTAAEAQKAGREFGQWFMNGDTVDRLWRDYFFDHTLAPDEELEAAMTVLTAPEIQDERAALIEAHSAQGGLLTAVESAIATKFEGGTDPFTGKAAPKAERVLATDFHKAVRDELFEMGERDKGRTASIIELMREKGYRYDKKHGANAYIAPETK